MDDKKKEQTARSFYNDTFLSDQNACTSPRLVYWYGDKNDLDKARTEFWDRLWNIVKKEYSFQDIQGIGNVIFWLLRQRKLYIQEIIILTMITD